MKKNTWKRHAALALVGAMAVGSLYGCGSKSASSDNTQTTAGETEGTEKVDNTVYIWYNVSIKYRRCFYDRTTAEIGAKSIHGNI